ncbi:MAG: type II toxin-antitoxin system PemK/MazF family toxin, partial [Chloroflexi bacterium]|nr:type II toxin-antitoxin system PemK/MazF family toxin [Chloroflexota bacterium]
NDDAISILPLKVIVPVTDWKERYAVAPWMVKLEPTPVNGLSKPSAADAFQVRSVSQQRFARCLGALSPEVMYLISNALAALLNIENGN